MEYEFHCPHCNKKLFKFIDRERKYGTLIYTCKYCSGRYVDPRYHECAIEGIPENEFGILQYLIAFVCGGLILWRGLYLFNVRQLGMPDVAQPVLPTVFAVLGALVMIASVIEIIIIKTGLKRRKFEKLFRESVKRLKNESYVEELAMHNVRIPDEIMERIRKAQV